MGIEGETNWPLIIAVDWDDTIALGPFDGVQTVDQEVVDKLRACQALGAQLTLWTCRCNESLERAVAHARSVNLRFDSVNEDAPAVRVITKAYGLSGMSNKVYAHLYVDDKAPGSIEHFKALRPVGTYQEYTAQLAPKQEKQDE